jgi:hypothetical protein
MQEEITRKSIAVTYQAARLTGRILRSAMLATLRKMQQAGATPGIGRNSIGMVAGKDGGAESIEVTGRIWSFERFARKYKVRYHIEKEIGSTPPRWTVYFKANQADMLTAAFKAYTRKEAARENKPSLIAQLAKMKELAKTLAVGRVKNKEHGGPEL